MALMYESYWANFISLYPPGIIELAGGACIQYVGVLAAAATTAYLKPPLRSAVARTLPLAMANIFIGSLVHVICLIALAYRTKRPFLTVSLTNVDPSFPHLGTMLSIFAEGLVIYDAFFYAVHWFLHRDPFFRYFHSLHHGIHDKIPTAGYYNHPAEHILVHMVGPYWLPMALSAHILSFFAAVTYYVISTQVVHFGLDMPFMNHDGHDINSKKNMGAFGFMDLLLGSFMSRSEVTEWETKWSLKERWS